MSIKEKRAMYDKIFIASNDITEFLLKGLIENTGHVPDLDKFYEHCESLYGDHKMLIAHRPDKI